jgi:HEAT repeat protein
MTHKDLIQALRHPDADRRQMVHEELAIAMDDELAQAIVDLASGDDSDEIRAEAVVTLGPVFEECGIDYDEELEFEWGPEIGPPVSPGVYRAIVQRVRALYEDETEAKEVRRRAFEVLVRDPQPWQRQSIIEHFASQDGEWRLTAIFGMGAISGFDSELLQLVKSAEGEELFEAVRAARERSLTEAAPRIISLAMSDETARDTRCEAILALPHVDPTCHDLLKRLSLSDDEEIADVAQEAMDDLTILSAEPDEELDDDFDDEN